MVTTRSSTAAASGKPVERPQRPNKRNLITSAKKKRALAYLRTMPGTPPNSIEEWLEKKQRRNPPPKAPVVSVEDEKEDEEEQGVFFTMGEPQRLLAPPHPANIISAAFDAEEPAALNGSEEAIALLRKIEKAAEEPAGESVSLEAASPRPSKRKAPTPTSTLTPKPVATPATETPSRPIASPSGFFGRSLSAIKRTLGFSPAPAPAATPEPMAPELSQRPTPGTLAEVLTIPPTPVGERVHTPSSRRKKTHSTLSALMKGVEPQDKRKAEAWARKTYADLRLDPAFKSKRTRLETPVRVQDLVHMPCAKPWEGGYGDPLYYLDDEDIVPGWAVYLDMVAEEEDHKPKKVKTAHNTDEGEIQSLNEMVTPSNKSPRLYDSHGSSASLMDFHPRRSVEPSPMFETPVSHKQGGNVFSELKGHADAKQTRADQRESFQSGYKPATPKRTTPKHNPAKGSFSYPASDDDSSDDEPESGDGNAPATQVWTKAPPPAPVPAHAPLPEPVADASRASSVGAPETVDEVQRQRKMLMKHTPAKPSRLREATYPSPSLISDAGNESILAATPVQVATSSDPLFDDMPIMDSGDMDMEDLGSAEAYIGSTEWKNQFNASSWPSPPVYESDEEVLSPI